MRGSAVRGRVDVGEARQLCATPAANEDVRARPQSSRSLLEAIVETVEASTALNKGKDTHAILLIEKEA